MWRYILQYFHRPKNWRDVTVQDVLRMNTQRSLKLERERVYQATESLKAIMAKAVSASEEWNPPVEKLAIEIIVEAENAIRRLEAVNT